MSTEGENHRGRHPSADLDDSHARTGLFGASYCIFCGAVHGLQRPLAPEDECARCASPLFPAERHRFDYSGQRMVQRMPKRGNVLLYVGWPQSEPFATELRDLSLNGMRLAAASDVPVNQVVKVDSELCRALARVAHCERDGGIWTIGLEFLTLRFVSTRGSFVSARV
ncbi:MAG TPA: PilZ domain-containing protein [Gammaproteobacteria bacterium]|jgi:hypothetical protein|nr:PilZ domain-containing protein [Gammaproteobacteria bacterium]